MIGDTHSFTPTLVADFRLSFLRFSYDRTALTDGFRSDPARLARFDEQPGCISRGAHPTVTGYNGVFSTNGTGSTIIARNDVYSLVPSLTKIWGSHTLKFGAEIRRNTHNYYQQNSPSGNFNFDWLMTASNPFRRPDGDGFASFLLGYGIRRWRESKCTGCRPD